MPQVEEVQLGFGSLSDLDNGKIALLLQRHIANVAADCMNRPGDASKRVVQLNFNVVPVIEDDGGCETVKVEIECKSKVPTFRSKKYEMRVVKGGLLFNKDFPDELGQMPLFDGEEEE